MQQALFLIPPKKPSTQRLYEDVRREYLVWLNKRKNGVRVYSDEYIFAVVAEKFYKSPKTIENIVFNRV